jgi:hypothetical protein
MTPPMQEQDRELARSAVDVATTIALKSRSSASRRTARGTTPPDVGSTLPATADDTVECKTCKSRLSFANAIILQSHCLCSSCALADARKAAVAALPKSAETIKLDHQLGAPLAMLIVTVALTALLLIVYNV